MPPIHNKCQFPRCRQRRRNSKAKYCAVHIEVMKKAWQVAAQAKFKAENPYIRKPKKCAWCGEADILHPAYYCDDCRPIARATGRAKNLSGEATTAMYLQMR